MSSSTDSGAVLDHPAELPGGLARVARISLQGNRPLHERVPVRDEQGSLLGDFMVIFPGLRELPSHLLNERLQRLQSILQEFTEVVFADLNLPLNLLWVSVRPRPGVILELFAALQWQLPEARLVGHLQE